MITLGLLFARTRLGHTNATDTIQEDLMYDASRTMESDSFFRHVDRDWVTDDNGQCESPSGWFAFVEVDDAFRTSHEFEVPASVEDGRYLVVVNDHGTVWAFADDASGEIDVLHARLSEEYALWEDGE